MTLRPKQQWKAIRLHMRACGAIALIETRCRVYDETLAEAVAAEFVRTTKRQNKRKAQL